MRDRLPAGGKGGGETEKCGGEALSDVHEVLLFLKGYTARVGGFRAREGKYRSRGRRSSRATAILAGQLAQVPRQPKPQRSRSSLRIRSNDRRAFLRLNIQIIQLHVRSIADRHAAVGGE